MHLVLCHEVLVVLPSVVLVPHPRQLVRVRGGRCRGRTVGDRGSGMPPGSLDHRRVDAEAAVSEVPVVPEVRAVGRGLAGIRSRLVGLHRDRCSGERVRVSGSLGAEVGTCDGACERHHREVSHGRVSFGSASEVFRGTRKG